MKTENIRGWVVMTAVFLTFVRAGAAQQQQPLVVPDATCKVFFNISVASSGAQATAWLPGVSPPPTGSAGTSLVIDNHQTGCTGWTVAYSNHGFSALSLLFQSAPDNAAGTAPGTWAAVTVAGPLCTGVECVGINPNTSTTSAVTATKAIAPWFRVNLTAKTGTGAVEGVLFGYKYNVNTAGGGASPPSTCPGGADTQYQYNDMGACNGSTMLARDGTNRRNVMAQANVEFDPAGPPGAPTVALAGAAGNIDNGTHVWLVTYVTALGESAPGTISATINVVDQTIDGQVNLSAIAVSSNPLVLSKNIYRTAAGNTTPTSPTDYRDFFLLTNIPNAQTTFTDNVADGSLGSQNPPFDSTAGGVYWNSSLVGKWDSMGLFAQNLLMSRNGALYLDPTAIQGSPHRVPVLHFCCAQNGQNLFIGQQSGNYPLVTGNTNVAIGPFSMRIITTGSGNSSYGNGSLQILTTGQSNVGVGANSGLSVSTGSRNVFIGRLADLVSTQRDETVAIGYAAKVDANNAVSIGQGVTNAVVNSVNIGTNSTIYQQQRSIGTKVSPTITFAGIAAFIALGNGFQADCSDCGVTSGIDNTCAAGAGATAFVVNGAAKCFI